MQYLIIRRCNINAVPDNLIFTVDDLFKITKVNVLPTPAVPGIISLSDSDLQLINNIKFDLKIFDINGVIQNTSSSLPINKGSILKIYD